MKNFRRSAVYPLVLSVLFLVALIAVPFAKGGIAVPYTVDANTLHLWHFNDTILPSNSTNYQTIADAVTANAIVLTNIGVGAGTTGNPPATAGNPPYTNIFLAAISPATGVPQCLDILPDNGVPGGTGDSSAMAAGPQSEPATNFCNATTGAFTYEALVNCQGNIFSSGAGTGEWEIFCGDSAASSRGWQFRLQNAAVPVLDFNFISFYSGESQGNTTVNLPTTGRDALSTNQWYHVAVTYTGFSPTNGDTAGVLNLYWTLLDPTRTNADLLLSFTNAAPGGLGAAAPYPAVGGSQRTTHGIGNEGSFQGLITEVRVSQIARKSNDMAFNATVAGLPPTITQEPAASVFIGYGQTLTLSTLVIGSPTPSLQWQVTNTSGSGWVNLAGQTNSDLIISGATFSAATVYRLQASNNIANFPFVTNSTPSTVTVGAAFSEVFNTGCDANDLVETNLAGSNDLHYTLSDSADLNNPGPGTIVWNMFAYPIAAQGGGFANPDGVSQWIGTQGDGATYTSPQGTYIYRTHVLADSVDTTKPVTFKGTWWANTTGADILLNGESLGISTDVTNGGTVSALFTITNGFIPGLNTLDFVVPCVNPNGSYPESAFRAEISVALGQALPPGLPAILTQPATNETVTDSGVEAGSTVTYSVVATGRPPLTYQWVDQQVGALAGDTSRTLTFSNPTAGGQGTNFYVVVSNTSGSVTSSVAKLTIVQQTQSPVAANVSFSVYTNNTLDIDMSLLLLAATDPNGLPMTITFDGASTNGAAVAEAETGGSVVTYTPNPGFVGNDEFNYYVSDSDGNMTTAKILIDVLPQTLPGIIRASRTGANFVFSDSGGPANGSYVVLSSTNLALPLSQWTPVATGDFSNTGAFSTSLPLSPTNTAEFYTIELP